MQFMCKAASELEGRIHKIEEKIILIRKQLSGQDDNIRKEIMSLKEEYLKIIENNEE